MVVNAKVVLLRGMPGLAILIITTRSLGSSASGVGEAAPRARSCGGSRALVKVAGSDGGELFRASASVVTRL
jgi:hypothetical protein